MILYFSRLQIFLSLNLIINSSEVSKELTDKAREVSLKKLEALEKSKTN